MEDRSEATETKVMKYRSEANKPKQHEFSQSGFKKIISKYEDIIDKKTGKLETKITENEDFYEKIQSHKDSQLLDSIIKRYEIDIDKKQIKEISEDIVDLTNVPQTMVEAYSIIKQVENEFDQRPAEVKKAFNNNVGEYVAGIQNGKLKEILEKYQPKKVEPQTLEQLNSQAQQIVYQQPVQQPVYQQQVQQVQQQVQQQIQNTIAGGNTNV